VPNHLYASAPYSSKCEIGSTSQHVVGQSMIRNKKEFKVQLWERKTEMKKRTQRDKD